MRGRVTNAILASDFKEFSSEMHPRLSVKAERRAVAPTETRLAFTPNTSSGKALHAKDSSRFGGADTTQQAVSHPLFAKSATAEAESGSQPEGGKKGYTCSDGSGFSCYETARGNVTSSFPSSRVVEVRLSSSSDGANESFRRGPLALPPLAGERIQRVLHLSGVAIPFHHANVLLPQQQIMERLVAACMQQRHAILEAPTGMRLTCLPLRSAGCSLSVDISYGELSALFAGFFSAEGRGNVGTGKTAALLCGSLAWQRFEYHRTRVRGSCPILYLTRTHKQGTQVIAELRRSPFRARAVHLASREHLCSFLCSREVAKAAAGGEADVAAGAEGGEEDPSSVAASAVSGVDCRTAARLVERLRRRQSGELRSCAYLVSAPSAASDKEQKGRHVDSHAWMQKGPCILNLRSVVIVDEAHNIEDICRDIGSIDISVEQLQQLHRWLVSLQQLLLSPLAAGAAVRGDTRLQQLLQRLALHAGRLATPISRLLDAATEAAKNQQLLRRVLQQQQHAIREELQRKSRGSKETSRSSGGRGTSAAAAAEEPVVSIELLGWGGGGTPEGAKAFAAVAGVESEEVAGALSESMENLALSSGEAAETAGIVPLTPGESLQQLEQLVFCLSLVARHPAAYTASLRLSVDKAFLANVFASAHQQQKREADALPRISIHIWLLLPAVVFSRVAETARSVILASGTLAPFDSFAYVVAMVRFCESYLQWQDASGCSSWLLLCVARGCFCV
ncbi:hypothetical protein cyc_06836 [Cyclospora cayetanensis]|uniref:Helicase ATP-binding domain-containing protein n=1 Tax=Cyclospora cayetanensis TaxID=88456 RepID=A0A1D3CS69_9EIME|nr:hypothetical protein cyc_06836 [Cyclospora cayetanensis]